MLTDLGEIEIVVADPEPRRVLAPSRDRDLIDQSLSGIFLAPAGAAELVLRREQFLIELSGEPRHAAPAENARRASRDEQLLLRRQMDRLLGWLVEAERPTSRRAVLLVGDGWDLSPGEFYNDQAGVKPTRFPVPGLGSETRELARTLAAYGWIVAALAPPPPPVGVDRFGAFVLPDVTFPWLFAVKLRSLEVWLDGNRKPKKADALTELGHTLRRQGRLERAVEVYKKAIYHYYDHPKTALRQAAALVALGETLELQEDETAARAAFRTATAFDPALTPRYPFSRAALIAPHEPLERLAELTTGSVTRDPEALDRLLASLARRVRVTAQLPGTPDGALHRLDVRLHRPGFEHRAPSVARWGTPPAIAGLRLRRLLDGEPTSGGIALTASPVGGFETEEGHWQIELQLASDGRSLGGSPEPGDLLVSWASAGPEAPSRYRIRTSAISATGRVTLSIDPAEEHLWLALLVEEPAGSGWGGSTLELPAD
jgi:tetratricopeptide (TPR) repeat protein